MQPTTDRGPDGDRTPRRPLRLADLAEDPGYLATKERMGESLTPKERAILEAARRAAPEGPAGGAP